MKLMFWRRSDPVTDPQVSDVLDATADYLMTYGWVQGSFGWPGHPACVMGAIEIVTGTVRDDVYAPPVPGGPCGEAFEVLRSTVAGSAGLTTWNDRKNRSRRDVVRTLRETAQRERKAGR